MSLEDLSVDQLLAKAKDLEAQTTLFNALIANPETREPVQRAIKKLNPKVVIPEIDSSDKVLAAVATEREAREKLEQKIMERDAADRVRERRASIKSKYKLSDEDVAEVEKLMVDPENPIGNHDAAARVYIASRTSATPTPASYAPPTFTMPDKDTWAAGIGNPAKLNRIAIDESYKAWGEIMGGKVPGLGSNRAA